MEAFKRGVMGPSWRMETPIRGLLASRPQPEHWFRLQLLYVLCTAVCDKLAKNQDISPVHEWAVYCHRRTLVS